MNIIIPLNGKGERFKHDVSPKPLIPIFEKTMIEYVLDNLSVSNTDTIFIIYNKRLEPHNFCEKIQEKYQNVKLIRLEEETKGAVETIVMAYPKIMNFIIHEKTIFIDGDTFYTTDILDIFRNSNENMVFYRKINGIENKYSFVIFDEKQTIQQIREKEQISDNANTGAYGFQNINEFITFGKFILENNIVFKNEPYISCAINEMLKQNIHFIGQEIAPETIFSLGTPEEVHQFMERTYGFLFDLDGTLVLTDEIYFHVWEQILQIYNLKLTNQLFKQFIQGQSDKNVCDILLFGIQVNLKEISDLKDKLFIENIHNIKIIPGIYNFLKEIKTNSHKISIITNCNRKVAEAIIQYINIDKYVDFLISNSDCHKGKPDKEPYMNAIQKFNISNSKCIIFEDSKSGLLSAQSVSPYQLIGIETIYNETELKQYGVSSSFKDFMNVKLNHFFNCSPNLGLKLRNIIQSKFENHTVVINETKLKGGFICDVIDFTVENSKQKSFYILKYENNELNQLSVMAKQLELYKREYYFYKEIQPEINIHTAKYIKILKNEEYQNIGIILENLFKKNMKINLNLNIENIDISLKIVNTMAKLHSHFWNDKLEKRFPLLKTNTSPCFYPFFQNYIHERVDTFIEKWNIILNSKQIEMFKHIANNFEKIQLKLSQGHLTFIHGDIKSPNIFYDINNDINLIDWQHCAIGKGTQDLIFFIIESFEIQNIKFIFPLFKNYYYKKLLEYGVKNYSYDEFENDLKDALCYMPIFTAVWFGTIPNDELIDHCFPYFFISKLFYLLEDIIQIE